MRVFLARVAAITLVICSTALLTMCGDGGSSTLSVHDGNYTSNGSIFDWELNADGTFCFVKYANKAAKGSSTSACSPSGSETLNVTGTYSIINGFYKFVVSAASGTNAPSAGDVAGGFGVPNTFLAVKPLETNGSGDSEMKVFPAVGTCNDSALNVNWVQSGSLGNSGDISDDNLWGNANIPTNSGGNITGTHFRLDGTEQTGQTFATRLGCSNGNIDISGDSGFITQLASGWGIIAPEGGGDAIILVPRPSADHTASVFNGKTMSALVFMEDNGSGNQEVKALQLVGNSTGGSYTMYSDPFTGAVEETGTFTIAEVGTGEKSGFVKVTVSTGNSSVPTFWAAVDASVNGSGKTGFVGTGVDVDGTNDKTFSMVAIEQ